MSENINTENTADMRIKYGDAGVQYFVWQSRRHGF